MRLALLIGGEAVMSLDVKSRPSYRLNVSSTQLRER